MRLEKRYLTIVILAIVLAVPVTLTLQHRTHQLNTVKEQNNNLQLKLDAVQKKEQLQGTQLQETEQQKQELKKQNDDLKNQLQSKKDEAAKLAAALENQTGGVGGNFSAPAVRGSSAGNTYDYGYCTWYVKNRRPDIPNNWGDAMYWLGRAQAIGWATGSVPRAGAIGTTGNHVVYVESVSGNDVNISEMNYQGWNIQSSRTVPASYFMYIY